MSNEKWCLVTVGFEPTSAVFKGQNVNRLVSIHRLFNFPVFTYYTHREVAVK